MSGDDGRGRRDPDAIEAADLAGRRRLEAKAAERDARAPDPTPEEREQRKRQAARAKAKQRGDFGAFVPAGKAPETAPDSPGGGSGRSDGGPHPEPPRAGSGVSGGIPADPEPVSGRESDASAPRRGTGRAETAPDPGPAPAGYRWTADGTAPRAPEPVSEARARGHARPGGRADKPARKREKAGTRKEAAAPEARDGTDSILAAALANFDRARLALHPEGGDGSSEVFSSSLPEFLEEHGIELNTPERWRRVRDALARVLVFAFYPEGGPGPLKRPPTGPRSPLPPPDGPGDSPDPVFRAFKLLASRIMPPQPADPYPVRRRASLPDFDRDGAHLIGGVPDAFEQQDPQLSLPGFEPDGGHLPHWLLHWFGATGGPIAQGGRLPLELSLMVGGMARVPISDRNGRWRTLHLPHRIEHEERFDGLHSVSVERWLWPDGWGGNRRARWHLIPEALDRLRRGWAGWLAVPGLGRVAVLAPSLIPQARTDPLVELTVRIPRSAANGARFDWPFFARLAVGSATQARAYLSAAAYLHRSAHNGHPITRTIAAPVLGADGQPVRRKGGAIVRSDTEAEPNPQARFVSALTDVDLARMIGYPERGPGRTATHRMARKKARDAFEALAKRGVIDLVESRGRFRIFGPSEGG